MHLPSKEQFEMVPIEIRDQGSRATITFLLDLFESPDAEPLYRSKIMALGFENVGKTTLIDCLFPIKGILSKTYWVLQGHVLQKFKSEAAYREGKPPSEKYLLDKDWKVESKDKSDEYQINLNYEKKREKIRLFTPDKKTRDLWLTRFKRLLMNEATHGIAIQNLIADHPLVAKRLQERQKLELSVWDFGAHGQYYSDHHFFLSARTVFLVLFRLDKQNGVESLNFWLKSLSSHLLATGRGREFSILVIGTNLDREQVSKGPEEMKKRKAMVENIARTSNLGFGFDYYEVSCHTLENVEKVQESIFKEALSHSYMGERIPKTYLIVEEALKFLGERHPEYPVIDIEDLASQCSEKIFLEKVTIIRALSLLSLWGSCCFFPTLPEISNLVISDPRFLTKDLMASLFSPANTSIISAGILKHKDLLSIWPMFRKPGQPISQFWKKAQSLLPLMEKFEVTFPLTPKESNLPFEERESLVPALLQTQKGLASKEEKAAWPSDPPHDKPIEIERSILFNVLPIELVSRLLVRLHHLIQDNLVWRNRVILLDPETKTQANVRISVSDDSFCATLRGTTREDCEGFLARVLEEVTFLLFFSCFLPF